MAELIQQQELNVEVDFFGFGFQEVDDRFVPVGYPEGRVPEGFLAEHPGRIDVESGGHTHTASLTVEVWDAEPPSAEAREAWEAQGEARIRSASGELAFWAVAGPMPEYVRLPDVGREWQVRVYCAGREEVRRLTQESVPEGVERYLAQFWPIDA
ncbi:hypothetical protein [Streptomyces sp. ISL-100]|uniref:hypothetical protein n=1 Tax=Streptomyces sp. ISL-100 TaxID=2819173 RepID=UPI001BEC6095|nr:hypothetical protein [Streptomyces sp. ISL-100]MBT2400871.1 hypothetical protein [Streptomyces sp. ISL-100]